MQLFKVGAGAKIADSTGSVRVIRDGVTVFVKAGDSLQEGDVVVLSSSDKLVLNSDESGSTSSVLTHDGMINSTELSAVMNSGSDSGSNFLNTFFRSSDGESVFKGLLIDSLVQSPESLSGSFALGKITGTSYALGHVATGPIAQISDIAAANTSLATVSYVLGKGIMVEIASPATAAQVFVTTTGVQGLLATSTAATTSVSTVFSVASSTSAQTIDINKIIELQTVNVLTSSNVSWVYGTAGADYYVMAPGGSNRVDLGAGNDIIVTTGSDFKSTDVIVAGSGLDTLIFTTIAVINETVWANKSGIDALQLDGSTNVVNMNFWYAADTGEFIIYNGANTISSLKAWDFTHVVIAGEGLVQLGSGTNNTVYAMEGVNTNIGLTDWTYWIYGNTGNDTYWGISNNVLIGAIDGGAGYDTIRYTNAANTADWHLNGKTGIDALQFTVNGNVLTINDSIVTNSDNHVLELLNSGFTITSLNTSQVLADNHVVIAGTGAVTLANRTGYEAMSNVVYGKDGVNTFVIGSNADNYYYAGSGNDSYMLGTGKDTVLLGSGNDFVLFNAIDTVNAGDVIDAGSGIDTLAIVGAGKQMLLTDYADTIFKNIEVIDINGTGGNLLVMRLSDVLALSDTTDVLYVRGGADDELGFAPGETWTWNGIVVDGGISYYAYTAGSATVYVQTAITAMQNYSTANNTYTLTSGADVVAFSSGNDTFITTNANFTTADILNGGLGYDVVEFLDAANISSAEWANMKRIDILRFNANNNVVDLDLNYVSDTGQLEIQNQGFTVTSLAARQISNVVIAGTGLVTLNSGTNNYLSVKAGVNANLVLAGTIFSVYGSSGSENYYLLDTYLNGNNTLSAGNGIDTLIAQNALSVTAADLINFSGIEIIRLSANNNTLVFTDDFVNSSASDRIELQNQGFTVTSLDTSALTGSSRVILAGTGAVTLADGVNNVLYVKDGVDATVTGGTGDDTYYMGTGTDTVNLGAGDDTVVYSLSSLSAGDVIIGGSDNGVFGYGDTIHIGASETGQLLDLFTLGDGVFQGFEVIDMTGDYRVDGVQMLSSDVIALTGTGILFIRGDQSSQVGLLTDTGGWTQLSDYELNGIVYHVYSSDIDMAVVYVQSGIEVFVNSIMGLQDTVTLGAVAENLNLRMGDDLVITSNADFTSNDVILGGLGFDTIRFTDTAILDHVTNSWWNKGGFERIELQGDNNVLLLDGYYQTDGGSLEIANNANAVLLKAWDYSHVVIAGTGLVTLGSGTNNTVYTKAGVDTNIVATDWSYLIYGNTGNDTLYTTSGNFVVGAISYGLGFDVVEYTNAANNQTWMFNGKSGIDALRFTVDGNYVVLNNDIVANSDNHMLEIQNQGHSVTLSTSLVLNPAENKVVIAGTGDVYLSTWGYDFPTNELYAKDGVDTNVFGTDAVWVTNTFHGGTGNDTYTLNTSTDIVSLGEGQDTFKFGAASFSANDRIDGGGAADNTLGLGDILRFTASNQHLDLTGLNDDVIKGIEIIDLHNNSNSLTMNINDVLALSNSTDDVLINGGSTDTVTLKTTVGGWMQDADHTVNGITYKVYTSNTADDARVLVDNSMTVVIL